jgi:hypothetical protein
VKLAIVSIIKEVADSTEVIETKLQTTVTAIVGNLWDAKVRLQITQTPQYSWGDYPDQTVTLSDDHITLTVCLIEHLLQMTSVMACLSIL